jgi:hypothetical protein
VGSPAEDDAPEEDAAEDMDEKEDVDDDLAEMEKELEDDM